MLHFPKTSRYTLGARIDSLFLDILEAIFSAASLSPAGRSERIKQSALKLDSLKFLLQVSWQIKSLDTKKYAALSVKIDEVGKMLGGWLKYLTPKQPSPENAGEETR